jgi:hypothetical protein
MSTRNERSKDRQVDDFEFVPSRTNLDRDDSHNQAPDEVQEPSSSQPTSSTQQSGTQPTIPNVSQSPTESSAKRLRLETFITDFRSGRKTRFETFTALFGELASDPGLTAEEKEITFSLYSAEIDSAEERSQRHLGLSGDTNRNERRPDEPRLDSQTHVAKQTQVSVRQRRQCDTESEYDSDVGEPRKRIKVDESEMPWFESSGIDDPGTNPSCAKTVNLLRLFNRDIKKCTFWVAIAPGSPDNIPTAQWIKILKGESVDLDQILSSLHRVTVVEERKARIGDTDISLGPTEATRKVSTSSDWSTAWRRAARAVAFVFPHRSKELEDYAEYIESEFAAKNPTGHSRIILYDIAVRNLVRGGQQHLLTDTSRFMSLYSATVLPDGVQYTYSGRKPQNRGKTEICNRFNDKGCNGPSCRYRHVCKGCGSSSHGKTACGSPTKN